MNIYVKKQLWKVILGVIAFLIIGFSFYYTDLLVKQISEEEKNKALLWAQAIREKAALVKYTNELFTKLEEEERKKGELWANGMKRLTSFSGNEDISFIFEVIKNNESVPVILTDENNRILSSRNLDPEKSKNDGYLYQELEAMAALYPPIEINILNKTKNYLYYKDSKLFSELKQVLDNIIGSFMSEVVRNSASIPVIYTDSTFTEILAYGEIPEDEEKLTEEFLQGKIKEMLVENEPIPVELSDGIINYIVYLDSYTLTKLRYYPIIQFTAVGLFVLLGYVMFSTSRKAEQNQVWVGMSKETAHQLGTPISSLIAWMELLQVKYEDEDALIEMKRDIKRLETITDRFSKIGSEPKLEATNMKAVFERSVGYLKSRLSKEVRFSIEGDELIDGLVNVPLFEWVVENLTKNAVDAMGGKGEIHYAILKQDNKVIIDVSDTGRGLSKSNFKTVFEPGYTTKKRGWGLGLTLVKRIIENYHKGKIFVKQSAVNNGTTFRIILNVPR